MSNDRPVRRTTRPSARRIAVVTVAVLLVAGSIAGAAARSNPDLTVRAVDLVRGVLGPAPVAAVEDAYYRVADVYNRLHYRLLGDQSGWKLTEDTAPKGPAAVTPGPENALASTGGTPVASDTPEVPAGNNGMGGAGLTAATPVLPRASVRATATATPKPLEPLQPLSLTISSPALLQEGIWEPLPAAGQAGGDPLLWQTVYRPDPQRPFAHVALVAMDLSRSQLHIVIGTNEPVSKAPAQGLRPGAIPSGVQESGGLLAAWNGGFRAVHGAFGMMTDGVTWLPPQDGLATVALRPDGTADLGAWGRRIKPEAKWAAWRQNDPPLIEDGQVNPDVIKFANTIRWGAAVDGATLIWRSGMGMSRERRWLIYAAGNSLSVETLTRALRAAGAWDAMQLDVNASFERFVTYDRKPQTVGKGSQTVNLAVTARRLIDQMQGGPSQFLVPYDRDFFYLTAVAGTAQGKVLK